MKKFIKSILGGLCVSATIMSGLTSAQAQSKNWPNNKPITVIVPYTPGGSTDTVTRIVMDKLAKRLGQTIIIENKPGANATIGTSQLARAKPDGYSFIAILAAHSVNPHLYKLPYTNDNFETVTQLAELPMFLFVTKEIPANTVEELVAYGKEHPLTFASSGTGSSAHMIGLHFADRNDLDMTHVPYRGSAPILSDLLAGRVSMAFDPILVPMPYVKEDKLKVLALSAKSKWPDEPQIPLMTELGYENFDLSSWVALLSPKNTPKEIVDKMAAEIAIILEDDAVKEKFTAAGFVPKASTPKELSELISKDSAVYKQIIEKNNVKLE